MTIFRRLLSMVSVACFHATVAYSQQTYILQTKDAVELNQAIARHGLILNRQLEKSINSVVVTVPGASAAQLALISADPAIVDFEPDQDAKSPEAPNTSGKLDPLATSAYNKQTEVYFGALVRKSYVTQACSQLIELTAAHQQFVTGQGIVAIIDTGVDPTHPALRNVLLPGYDFTRNQPGGNELADLSTSQLAQLEQSTVAILDGSGGSTSLSQSTVAILDQSTVAILDGPPLPSHFGHGTMVAGLVHLVAPTASILPLKAFNATGHGALSDIVRAIYFAVNNGASVINMSFSLDTRSPALEKAVQYASSHNVIMVASAGNGGKEEVVYPAGLAGVIGVGSTNGADRRSPFTNFNVSSVAMAAPGEALVSTFPGRRYAGVWGTSFSAALTTGTAALLLQSSGPSSVLDALKSGKPLSGQDVGDARLDVLLSLLSTSGN